MEKNLSPFAFFAAAVVFTLALLGASVVAPHDRYYRWQEHNSGATRKADWIYERLHFDAAPVDVALIGTSRTAGGLSGPDIETLYCRATGRKINIANLSIPETGRNMHYVIAKETARTKRPTLFVVELNETEPRKPHHGFILLADAGDVLTAPAFINVNYFSDLARLPGRQLLLGFKSLLKRGAVRPDFDPGAYPGRDLDRTRALPLLDGRLISRFQVAGAEELDAGAKARSEAALKFRPPKSMRRFEHRFSRLYLKKIEALAAAVGGETVYAYLPAWRAPVLPAALVADLEIDAPIFDLGGSIAEDPAKWLDATHVNAWGAREQSARMAQELARAYPLLGEPADCPRRSPQSL